VYFESDNLFETISNLEKAISLDPANSVNLNFNKLSQAYLGAGFDEKARYYNEEALRWNNDSSEYNFWVSLINYAFGDYEAVLEFSYKVLEKNPLDTAHLEFIAMAFIMEHQYDSALVYYTKLESLDHGLWNPRWFGYTLIQNGEVAKGERYIDEAYVYFQELLDRETFSMTAYIPLGEIYAYRGEKEKAIEQLRTLARQDGVDLYHPSFQRSPLWDNIRNEPEFQQIMGEFESKYQAEHERVKEWLEENDML
jgi:tetratricopeptide (TPR) repeat protein